MLRLGVLVMLAAEVLGLPTGAPPEACHTMTPQHQSLQPSSSPVPFQVKVDQTAIAPGQILSVTLESYPGKYRYFQGFLMVAVQPDNFMHKLGNFATNTEKYVACGPSPYSAVTHAASNKKSAIQIRWMAPPDYQGPVVFLVTFVENFSTFWIGQQSPIVTVTTNPIISVPPTTTTLKSIFFDYNTIKLEPSGSQNGHLHGPEYSTDVAGNNAIYDGCDLNKGCYGEPAGCTKTKNCIIMATFQLKGNDVEFHLTGPANGWIALGFSKDRSMGDDSVVECVHNPQSGIVQVYSSVNNPGYRNVRLTPPQEGLSNTHGQRLDDRISCSFNRQGVMAVNGMTFDLLHESYHLFLASGPVEQGTDRLQRHSSTPYRSEMPVDVTTITDVAGSNDSLLYAHGSLMVIAWIGTTSVAVFLARFFKYTWIQTTHCGEQVWFTWHRSLNACTVTLTSISIIIIFTYVGGWSMTLPDNAHPVLGILTTVLMWIQPFMAAIRPHPGTPNRPIFNWAHFLVGNFARILAVATMFLAQSLQKARLPSGFTGVLIAYVVFEFLCHLVMEGYSYVKARSGRDSIPLKEMPPTAPPPENTMQKSKDAPGSRFRRSFLILYTCGIACLTVALVGILISSSTARSPPS